MIFFIEIIAFLLYNYTKKEKSQLKYKLYTAILSLLFSGFLCASTDEIKLGNVNFVDANWDINGELSLSKQRISDITSRQNAVIMHFFTAQTC